ncbi:MAG: polymerase subunit sigma-70 [Caulobacteraceae bacterium]|nr:polymerase subunit sigma-70 [Caulobacteraceae bacterium]
MDRKSQDARFREWMEAQLPMLRRMCRAFAQPADQPDLMQDMLLALWRAAPAWRGEASATTFVYRVAFNAAAGWRRRIKARASPQAEDLALMSAADPGDDERLERLYAGLRQLGESDRALLMLSLDGLDYRQIAELHGITETNVGARLSRARARLTTLIQETSS